MALAWPGRTGAVLVAILLLITGCVAALPERSKLRTEVLQATELQALPGRLQESSGLAGFAGRLWSMNDGGNAAQLIWWDPQTAGQGQVELNEAVNFDWEALAQSDDRLFIVDCGNNRGDRIWLQLYTIDLESLAAASGSAAGVRVERSEFRWGDREPQLARRNHDNDCEAAVWINERLWLFTKNWRNQATRLYQLTPGLSSQSPLAVAEYPVAGLITGADYSPEFNKVVLLGYGSGLNLMNPFLWFVPVAGDALVWDRAERYRLGQSGQWEAVLWQGDHLLLTRENSPLGRARSARVELPRAVLTAN